MESSTQFQPASGSRSAPNARYKMRCCPDRDWWRVSDKASRFHWCLPAEVETQIPPARLLRLLAEFHSRKLLGQLRSGRRKISGARTHRSTEQLLVRPAALRRVGSRARWRAERPA